MKSQSSNSIFDVEKIRKDFPILSRTVNGKPLIYLDNAATSQTPQQVIDVIVDYYSNYNANIHRGVHTLSQEATDKYENARQTIQQHFNAKHAHEIIFTSGTTHSINLVANGFTNFLTENDTILVSALEHHSNIVPWQMLCEKTKATLKVIPMTSEGDLDMVAYDELLLLNPKLVFVNHISNALGTINPIKEMIQKAHLVGAAILVDGAQACPHIKPDVQALDVDFYVTSGHKMCGPTGVGMLYAKESWLHKLPPYQGGGEMISTVTMAQSTYAGLPFKFEAGTPNIEAVVGWGAALDWMNAIGMDSLMAHESDLMTYGTERLTAIDGLVLFGTAPEKSAVLSFGFADLHPYDLGTLLDQQGIAVRTGQHCAQPIMDYYNIPGTVRASFAAYSSREDVDRLADGVERALRMLR